MKQDILTADTPLERPARPDLAAARELWEEMFSQWPEGPPHEQNRKKAADEAAAIAAAIRAAHPGPFPDSTEEIRRSRDADWGEEDGVDS